MSNERAQCMRSDSLCRKHMGTGSADAGPMCQLATASQSMTHTSKFRLDLKQKKQQQIVAYISKKLYDRLLISQGTTVNKYSLTPEGENSIGSRGCRRVCCKGGCSHWRSLLVYCIDNICKYCTETCKASLCKQSWNYRVSVNSQQYSHYRDIHTCE